MESGKEVQNFVLKLEVSLPGKRAREVEIAEFPASIGRDRDCSLHVEDGKVSRRHAVLEERANRFFVVDRGSTNGVRLNGGFVREAPLSRGDEIAVGGSTIRVLAVPAPAPPPEVAAPPAADPEGPAAPEELAGAESTAGPAPALPGFRRRRLLTRLAPPLLLLLLLGGAGYWIYLSIHGASRPGRPRTGLMELTRELDGFEQLAAERTWIPTEFVSQVEQLKERYRHVRIDGPVHPVDELAARLRDRRNLDGHNLFFNFDSKRRELLEARKFAEALELAERLRNTFGREMPSLRMRAEGLHRATKNAVDRAFQTAEIEIRYLEHPEYRQECLALFEAARRDFAGLRHATMLEDRLEDYNELLAAHDAREKQRLEDLRQHLEALRREESRETEEEEARPVAIGLSGLLSGPIRAGALKSRSYRFAGFSGKPVDLRDDAVLLVQTSEEERSVSFADVPRASQVKMALDALAGSALLEAASIGYQWGLETEAGRLLHKYLGSGSAQRAERQAEIDRLLATLRGLDDVPEGGFTYHRVHGWEDAKQREERKALEEATRLTAKLTPTTRIDRLESTFESVLAFVRSAELSERTRAAIRNKTVEALSYVKTRLEKELERQLRSTSLGAVRQAKLELQRRRREAIEAIYDTKRYLPENHPDYSKGDQVNGQAEVDRLVQEVRDLWENAGRYTVNLNSRVLEKVKRVKLIREKFYPALHHTPPRGGDDGLEEILNNLDRAVDLKTYALDRSEVLFYRYNRKVEAYNRSLQEPDLAEGEREHVILVNDYREMLGRRRLFIDIRLCRATRKHSEACNRAGRIWHNGPDGTPGSRARAENFPAGVAENVAIGYASPGDIWTRGWYRASDHHRNALGAGWSCIGYGYAGRVGTQNFSSIAAPFK